MTERRDYLAVCNDHGVPLPDFQAMFCIRCVQPECTRSRQGGLFETRVSTWEDRLFRNPPRMPKDDPRYPTIAAKRFLEIDTGRTPELVGGKSEWVDPLAMPEPRVPRKKPRTAKKNAAPTEPREQPPAAPEAAPKVEAPTRPMLNTPFTQGAVLSGALTSSVERKPVDAWAPVQPTSVPTESIPIVKAGARLKFGG